MTAMHNKTHRASAPKRHQSTRFRVICQADETKCVHCLLHLGCLIVHRDASRYNLGSISKVAPWQERPHKPTHTLCNPCTCTNTSPIETRASPCAR